MPRVSGYIAGHVADQLLAQGHFVRGTARDPAKAKPLADLFNKYGDGKFEVVKADLGDENAFVEAVKGMDYIFHLVSAFHLGGGDPWKNYINPATHGTPTRVIITSSSAAILDFSKLAAGHIFTEEDWNNVSIEQIKQQGEAAGIGAAYLASKTESERAAWKFMDEKKPNFALTTLLPVFVLGPPHIPPQSPTDIRSSLNNSYPYISGALSTLPPRDAFSNFVDVRDVAAAHIKAAFLPIAEGKRYILSAGAFTPAGIAAVIRKGFPGLRKVPTEGAMETGAESEVSSERARSELGVVFRGLEECVRNTVGCMKGLV
ncbi:methylglyoxal reductase (NADPH-dependent) gre2 [Rhizophlyctis rosea]|nr:methylglyoxal reductase (NADPH-dependent) gre2 [Rhizophlyctis rosea]